MPVMSKEARIKALAEVAVTDNDLAQAESILKSLKPFEVTFNLMPIPMNGGKYGYMGERTVTIDGVAKRITAVVVHPNSKNEINKVTASMQRLAERRIEARQQATATLDLKSALAAMTPAERKAFLAEQIAALGDDESDDD